MDSIMFEIFEFTYNIIIRINKAVDYLVSAWLPFIVFAECREIYRHIVNIWTKPSDSRKKMDASITSLWTELQSANK